MRRAPKFFWFLVSGFWFLISAFCFPLHAGSRAEATHAAVATASPYATQVGLRTLQGGGNAADASTAIAFALAVARPHAAGIGGGGFLVYYDAATRGVWTLDFREVSPVAAKGVPNTGPGAAAVPGMVAGIAALHERFGTKKWENLVFPAVALARDGVRIDAELASAIKSAKVFPNEKLDDGGTLVQAELAATLERISVSGAREFYDGETARHIVDDGRAAGGLFTLRDLREYKAIWRAPIRIAFRGAEVYTVAPPSAGGLMITSMLKIIGNAAAPSAHLIAEAERRAAIDRDKYLGDPAVARIPLRELLSDERAAQWRASINPKRSTPTITLAEPAGATPEAPHTTHFSVVDAQGNVAAVTMTLGDDFGGGFLVPGAGFYLNNAMKDFAPGAGAANAMGGGKRMASPLAPAIVLRNGKPLLALGSSGGAAIPAIVANIIVSIIVNNKSLDEAVAAARYDQQAVPEDLAYEPARARKADVDALVAIGHGIRQVEAIGDVHAVMISGGKLIAVSDPRHGGAAGAF